MMAKKSKRKAAMSADENEVAQVVEDVTSTPVPHRWWMHLLAVFVAFHCIGAVLMSAPSPEGSLKRSAWKEKTAQAEFHAWAQGVRSIGISVTDEAFEEFLWDVGKEYVSWKKMILKPYSKYAHTSGARQGWRMFVAPHRNPSTLNVDVEEKGASGHYTWRNVFGSADGLMDNGRSYSGQWRAQQFRHNRVAKTVFLSSWKFRRHRYREFSHWISQQAAKDFPEAKRVRIRQFRYRTLTPEEVRQGMRAKGEFHNTKIFDLESVRARVASQREVSVKLLEGPANLRRAQEKKVDAREAARDYKTRAKQKKKKARAASKKRAEEKRAAQEATRKAQEATRKAQEATRKAQEATRKAQEVTRKAQEELGAMENGPASEEKGGAR